MSDTVKSPITGSSNVKKIDELTEDFFVKNYQQKYGLDVRRFFSEHKKIGVYQCLDSNYIFYYPFVVGDSGFYEGWKNSTGITKQKNGIMTSQKNTSKMVLKFWKLARALAFFLKNCAPKTV
jgi:hypothetical protein